MPRVSVIVPIFNGMAYLPTFFDSLSAAVPSGTEIILIDDASTEPVFDTVPDFPRAETVTRLSNDTNLGYSVSVNRGFGLATGDVVVQLNTDLVLDPECILAMVELIEREDSVGIVGSKLVYPTTGLVQSVGMAFGDHSKRHVYRYLPEGHPLCDRTRELQIATGATVAMTRQVLELIGPLDERYFNHNNDMDHCLRARRHGLRNFVCAKSVAYHWHSQSGPARFARTDTAEAMFWERWGGRYEVDLDRFVDEALDHVLDTAPELATMPFDVIDLSRGADQRIVVERLAARWPGLEARIRPFRQMNNPAARLWLPLLLPHWVGTDPTPFVYLVDSHRELEENVLWFERRRQVVKDELIVDLSASVLRTSALPARVSTGDSGPHRPPGCPDDERRSRT